MATVKTVSHVSAANASLQDRLTAGTDTTLVSAIDAGTLGQRFNRQRGGGDTGTTNSARQAPANFTPPISVTGVSDPATLTSGTTKLTSGSPFAADSTEEVAIVGSALATKNSLSVGSTFTAYTKTYKVVGIYDAGNEFANAGMYLPLATLQTDSAQTGQITAITVTADNIENVDGVVSDIKSKLGESTVDVTSTKDQAESALSPLESIKSISLYSLIGSLVAGAVITLLIMMMIVRERRREIGVLKAIGSSNVGIVTQFVTESLVLTLMGSVIGAVLGVLLSNPVLDVLVKNSSDGTTAAAGPGGFGGGAGRIARVGGQLGGSINSTINNLHASVGVDIILYGFLAAIAIAIVGSAIPAFLIAKVKPAEVMRAE